SSTRNLPVTRWMLPAVTVAPAAGAGEDGGMALPLDLPIAPMLAKSVAEVPEDPDGRLLYEPKWDGFRGIVAWDGTEVEIGSRGEKPLTRYFPELVTAFRDLLPEPCVLDGEIVVPVAVSGG